MFDVGFGKLALIAIVALLVLGPERLPRVARTAGALVRRARSSWLNVRSEIERELAAEDMKQQVNDALRATDLRAEVDATAESIRRSVEPVSSTPASPAPSTPPAATSAADDHR